MALLSTFFKPKWQHDNPDIRRQAIAGLTDTQELLSIIDNEKLDELRQSAIRQIKDEQILERLLSHQRQDVRNNARQHWLKQLLGDQQDLNRIKDNSTLVRIAALTDDQDLRLQAIECISDQQERLQLAMHNPAAKVRLAAAEGITSTEKLQQLLQHSQGKDKAVYRLCKERLNADKARQDIQQKQQQQIDHLLHQAQQLNRLGYNPEFNGRLQVLNKSWSPLQEQASPEQQQQINHELEQAAQLLAQHAEEESRQAAATEQANTAKEQQQSLLQQLEQILPVAIGQDPQALSTHIKELQESWHQSVAHHQPAAEHNRQFENQYQQLLAIHTALEQYQEHQGTLSKWLSQTLPDDIHGLTKVRQSAQQWQATLAWPKGNPCPEWLTRIEDKQQQARQKLDELHQQCKSRLKTIDEQLLALQSALDEGRVKDAAKLHQKIHSNLRQVDSKQSQPQQRQAKALQSQLNNMRDWQGFATTPKKEALCQAMEALIEQETEPDVRADKIQQLQAEWKSLGTAQPDKALWQRFQAAGDKAYEPCRKYFADLAQQRQQHVESRQALTAELIQYEQQMDWDNADWKAVQKTLDVARDAFHQYSPVDRNAHKTTQADFKQSCDAIYTHLKAEYERNLNSKQQLVERAQAAISIDDLGTAIDRIKQLQQDWKAISVVPRGPDQKLWKQFRKHSDAVFARLEQEKSERKSRINDTVAQAEALAEQAKTLATSNYSDHASLDNAQTQLGELHTSFITMELPKGVQQRLHKQFSQYDQQLQQLAKTLHKAATQARWQSLIDRLQAIATKDSDLWQQAADLPKGYDAGVFEQAWQSSATTEAQAGDTQDPQLITISMEIVANVESPEDDKARRMDIQVQRLAQGMGKGISIDQERQQLVHDWLTAGSPADYQQRFIDAVKASL